MTGGLFRPFAMVDGAAVGVWAAKGGKIVVEHFRRLTHEEEAALLSEEKAVRRFLGVTGRDRAGRA